MLSSSLVFVVVLTIASSEAQNHTDDPMTNVEPIIPSVAYPDFDMDYKSSENSESAFLTNENTLANSLSEQKSCSYTFHVSNPECHENKRQENKIRDLYEEVTRTKLRIEDMRNQLIEERQQFPSPTNMKVIKTQVDALRREQSNTDERVSQLYLQLLHEIVNKRDFSLDILSVENKLLNHTIEYYKLKDDHNSLKGEHSKLKETVMSQQTKIDELSQSLRELQIGLSRVFEQNQVINVQATQPQEPQIISTNEIIAEESQSVIPPIVSQHKPTKPKKGVRFRDCDDVQQAGYQGNGIYTIQIPGNPKRIKVWCDLNQDPGGWLVIQQRSGAKVNFNRNWANYKRGFGKLRSDFWLGLDDIHAITNQTNRNYKLHIDMEDWNGKSTFVEYRSFKIGDEREGYRLQVGHYIGNAGDSLTWHNNMKFTTSDRDHDPYPRNCAEYLKGGWWFNSCAHSNLNGKYYKSGLYRSEYLDGVYWGEWRGSAYSLKSVSMKIRPYEFQ